MTYAILAVLALAGVALLYALVVRPWLKSKTWAKGFFDLIEPMELALFKKSETILVGRLLWVASGLVTVYDLAAVFMQSMDLTPITTRVFDFLHVPADLRGVCTTAFITALGLLINWLRKRTTKPVELVAVQESKIDYGTQIALNRADAAKEDAVAAVKAT